MTAVTTEVPQRREIKTALPGPRSQELAARRANVVAGGVGSVMPVYAARASGGIIEDVDGNLLIDLGSGIAVTTVGSSAPRVVEGVQRQVADITHTCFMISPYEGYVQVCEQLAELTPGDHAKKSALFNSGAEAVENAVKIARYATGRQAVVAVDHAYHGRTNLTMALTAKAMPYKKGFGPFASDVYRVPTSYPFRDPEGMTGEQAAQRAILAAEKAVGASDIAALIIEPIQGEGGFIVPAPGFLAAIAAWCTDNGIVLIADEVQSGFARTGAWFASDHEGVVPDLVTTAKGIAGGLPLAAVTGRAELMDSVHSGGLGGTYGGNPVACAAALGAIETMREENLVERAQHIEDLALGRLRELQQANPAIGDVRGRGGMLAIEIVKPGTTEPDAALTAAVAKKCHEQGVVILTCGTYGNVIRLLPPLVISDELLLEGLDVLAAAF
ncbi:4-aminobutyrate--2-oxoglutarate transaminase [Luteipulveratus sp. YIM 133132]|uniref:(S)-3-amino-2-methylpropionate transaminase n=1 Tax=Luteipulveratus flavus TaxID=3031728 RepID=A0ABT6C862_9MICO|nr:MULTISPECIES: 4-aminobutyrate--2-oxoglutarate transaminase [unclassified Luteipulveratus]MDE9365873.1 4-aminobutyrate--2-oxoglutarate transaminase [Luteipulveratus sp. YIM 133132]MDF8265065.1 4-aminobutyrate--2-oxoglutarate transaminase [Luteipulveratus sp. YIM 133296]